MENSWENNEAIAHKASAAGKTAEKISQYLLWGMLLLFACFAGFIYWMKDSSRRNSIANQEVHDVVVEIHQEKSDVGWYRGRMGNGDWITLNKPMVYSVAVGDSLIKEKGLAYFTVKKHHSGQARRWEF